MASNNPINNSLPLSFSIDFVTILSTPAQINYLSSLSAPPLSKIVVQQFTSSGTYTPTTNMKFCIIECLGGGGGSGGVAAGSAGIVFSAGGGGGGGYAMKWCTAADIGTSQTVTVGVGGTGGASGANDGTDGGTTSVGSLCSTSGGGKGFGATSVPGAGGSEGGLTATGDVKSCASAGSYGVYIGVVSSLAGLSSCGGGSRYGDGYQYATLVASAGKTGTGYGSGASGATSYNGLSAFGGANGNDGLVIITEFVT